jgi:hypothetical protein
MAFLIVLNQERHASQEDVDRMLAELAALSDEEASERPGDSGA